MPRAGLAQIGNYGKIPDVNMLHVLPCAVPCRAMPCHAMPCCAVPRAGLAQIGNYGKNPDGSPYSAAWLYGSSIAPANFLHEMGHNMLLPHASMATMATYPASLLAYNE